MTTPFKEMAARLRAFFMKLYIMDVGFPTDHLLTMRMQLPEAKYASTDARLAFFEQLEDRLAAVPGVEAVAVTTGVPPFDGGNDCWRLTAQRKGLKSSCRTSQS